MKHSQIQWDCVAHENGGYRWGKNVLKVIKSAINPTNFVSSYLIPNNTHLLTAIIYVKEKGKEKKEVRTHDQEPPASSHLQVVA